MTIEIIPPRKSFVGEFMLTIVFHTNQTSNYNAFCDMVCDAPTPSAPRLVILSGRPALVFFIHAVAATLRNIGGAIGNVGGAIGR